MTKFHSHYESLNVTRDAPPEVIRAAYRSLSQKHHPDKNSGNVEAARMMARLNAAYSVLSDADQRELYDLQILSEQRIRSPEFAYQASVDDDSAPVPYQSFAPEQSGRGTRTASETPASQAGGKAQTLRQQLGHFARGRAARVAALVLALVAVVMLPLLWFLWKDNQAMMRLEQAAMYAPGTAASVPDEAAKAKPAVGDLAQKPPGKDGVAAEETKPAAVQKAPATPSAAIKASEFERLTAMLKNMGLGLHKLDLPAAPSSARQAPPPAKPAETAKASAPP
ncbi:DnaJ domain-containing protein, partial [Duganella vulcania]